jgi:hypothetical protein
MAKFKTWAEFATELKVIIDDLRARGTFDRSAIVMGDDGLLHVIDIDDYYARNERWRLRVRIV